MSCALSHWPSYFPSAGLCPVCQSLSHTGGPKTGHGTPDMNALWNNHIHQPFSYAFDNAVKQTVSLHCYHCQNRVFFKDCYSKNEKIIILKVFWFPRIFWRFVLIALFQHKIMWKWWKMSLKQTNKIVIIISTEYCFISLFIRASSCCRNFSQLEGYPVLIPTEGTVT